MNDTERLLKRCELLKTLIEDLRYRKVEENQRSVKEIQLMVLREQLTEVGRQLNRITLYKRDEND